MRSPTLARAAAIAILAISGVVGAFATIAPGPDGQALPPTTALVETLSIRADDALLPSPASYFREEPFQRGDTLASFLSRLGIEAAQVARLARLRGLQTLRPGSLVNAEVRADGVPISLSFLGERDTVAQIAPEGDSYRVSEERALLETRVDMKSSVIRSSLFAASDAAGIPDNVAMQLGEVFAGDIDFHRDLRKGDRFTVVYEVHHLAGGHARARSRRLRGRVRRSERRLRQRRVSSPSRPICHDLCAPEPYRRRRAPRRNGSAERYYRLCRPDRMGHWPAPALRVSHRRTGAQSVLDRDAGRAAIAGAGFSGVPVLREPADGAARPARREQPRPAGVGKP